MTHKVDICVVGGGLAGLCAAVAAARHGASVALMHDRPALGGNASSEIRMCVRGAAGKENRETGILQDIELENIYRNPTMNYSIWDSVLYQLAINEPDITLLLNCSCLDCRMADGKIASVTGWQLTSYTLHTVEARIFLDCSGDSILAGLSGAACRVGREGREEFGEYAAPEAPDRFTMGSSCLIEARKTDRPCQFKPPEWAYRYPDDESMFLKNHDIPGTGVNFWWIELGGMEDTISDAQAINAELLKVAYGVWDHIKNHGDHGMENWELEWLGFLPGKRESRRYEGPYMLCQRDLEEGRTFPDAVAFGGWTMDNHDPHGFYYNGYSSKHIAVKSPYQIPFRCLYSRNIPNLMFAGRNISASHIALSSTRVMATCSVIGQAAGTGAALAVAKGCLPDELAQSHIPLLQSLLLEDGCFIPGLLRRPPEGMRYDLPEGDAEILRNGWERPHDGIPNSISIAGGGSLRLRPALPNGGALRLALDPDFSRESIASYSRYQKFAMRTHIGIDDTPLKMPACLLRGCVVTAICADGSRHITEISENRRAMLRIKLPENVSEVEISGLCSWGGGAVRLFACDIR